MASTKLVAALAAAAGSVAYASLVSAAPVYTPFLSVDFNDSTSSSPTQTGFSGFGIAQPSATTTLTETVGGYAVTIGINPSASTSAGASLSSRDRGSNGGGPDDSLYRDFALVTRDTGHALGFNYMSIAIAGLTPGASYEFTGFSSDAYSSGNTNREGYSPNVPAEYSPGSSPATGGPYYYTPVFTNPAGEYDDSVSFDATADNTGTLTIYAFADAASYSDQTATIVNGFQLGAVPVPEPTTIGLAGLGFVLLARRSRKA